MKQTICANYDKFYFISTNSWSISNAVEGSHRNLFSIMILPHFPLTQKVNTTNIHNKKGWQKWDNIN